MTQRTAALISIWFMILTGLFFAVNLFVVPHYAAIVAEMDVQLPFIARIFLNLSSYMIQNGFLFTAVYAILFVAIIVWYSRTKPQAKKS